MDASLLSAAALIRYSYDAKTNRSKAQAVAPLPSEEDGLEGRSVFHAEGQTRGSLGRVSVRVCLAQMAGKSYLSSAHPGRSDLTAGRGGKSLEGQELRENVYSQSWREDS